MGLLNTFPGTENFNRWRAYKAFFLFADDRVVHAQDIQKLQTKMGHSHETCSSGKVATVCPTGRYLLFGKSAQATEARIKRKERSNEDL